MADTALMFFLGLAGVVVLSSIAALLHPAQWVIPAGATLTVSWLAAVLLVIAAIIACPTLGYSNSYGWALLRSMALGCWVAFLAGCAAGFVVAATVNAINAISTWGAWSESRTNILILAAGPGLTILLLYMLSMPSVMQTLGLTGIKAGEFEISVAPSQTLNVPTDVPSLAPPQSVLGNLADKYTPWFQNIWPMFQPLKDPANTDFIDLAYFQRQALYIKYDPKKSMESAREKHLDVPLVAAEAHDLKDVAKTIWYQEEFIRSLRPVIGCAAFYHLYFPDIYSIKPFLGPMFETLVSIENELETIVADEPRPIGYQWINERFATLQWQAAEFVTHFHNLIPPIYRDSKINATEPDAPKWSDCEVDKLKWLSGEIIPPKPLLELHPLLPETGSITVLPPYLAILIANVYGALGEKDAGLRVLNSWLKWYSGLKDKPDGTRWLYDEAVWQFGLVQEADETLPTTTEERRYLEHMQAIFEKDWDIDLYDSGYKCVDAKAKGDLDVEQRMKIKSKQATRFSNGLEARLVLLYSNLIQRLLYATLQTLPTLDQDYLAPEHEDWARQLISSAQRCLLDEKPKWRDYRQATDGLLGGITLARWAEDGPRSGLVHPSTVSDVQKDAINALLAALPKIRDKERDDSKMDGFRSTPTEWETYRRIVNRTVLDLEAKLTK